MLCEDRPLIVGAGPVGLGAALLLARRGIAARVVEARAEPSPYSKALAVNPRTLDILGPTGVADAILERGRKIRGARLHRNGRVVASVDFAGVHPRHPYMVALSQAATERLLAEALAGAGVAVERGVRLADCRDLGDAAEATLEPDGGGPAEVVRVPRLLAADGARSTARHRLGLGFDGRSFADDWHLADVPLRTPFESDRAHVVFRDDGTLLFLIRVVDDARAEPEAVGAAPLWRVLANRPGPLDLLSADEGGPAGEPVWSSSFRVAHRVASAMARGRIYLAGDAAHIHSPVGARGMNLGLEDAYVFAELAASGRLGEYDALRRPVVRGVVRRVERISIIASAETRLAGLLRRFLPALAGSMPFIRRGMRATVAGLDHDLPPGMDPARGA